MSMFEKLVQLVGFIIRLYHVARSSERQTNDTTKADKYIYNMVGPGNLYRLACPFCWHCIQYTNDFLHDLPLFAFK